eukprot:12894724-Prorocentrum_lima.AAC.1
MAPTKEDSKLYISTNGSFAPGGARPRTVVVKLCGVVVHWASVKQSLTALRYCEAELVAAITGVKLGLG